MRIGVVAAALSFASSGAVPAKEPGLQDASPALVRALLESTPHLVRDGTIHYANLDGARTTPERSYCGWYEFDDRPAVGGLACGAGEGVLTNGQRVVVVPLDTGGNDMGTCDALLYTTVAEHFRFVGYIPARWCRLFIDIDRSRHLRSHELANGVVPIHESMADNNATQIITTYDLTGIRLRTLTRRRVTFLLCCFSVR